MPHPPARRFETLLDDLYAGVLDAPKFSGALAAIGRLFDAPAVTWLRVDAHGQLREIVDHGRDPELVRLFIDHYQHLDPTRPIVSAMRAGEWFQDDRVLDPHSQVQPAYVNDFAARAGIRWFRGGKVAETKRGTAFLSLQRPADATPFDAETLLLLDRLGPHLARVALLKDELSATVDLHTSTRSVLDGLATGMCLVDRHCRIVYANSAAERLYALPGVMTVRSSTLALRGAANQARLQAAVERAIDPPRQAGAFCPNPGTGWSDRVRIRILPAGSGHPMMPAGAGRLALLCLTRGLMPQDERELVAMFGFTRSEAGLVALLAQGHTPAMCAEQRHVAISTVRTQLKSIYLKAGVDSLARLLPLVLAMPARREE